ncbi:MAG: hypothetical protein WCI67_10800 [Chloroflexales bacterium]
MQAHNPSAAAGPLWRRAALIVLIVVGVGMTIFFGARAVRSFRDLQYIREQGLDRGTASVDAIRGWMTIRFIAVAYAVPEEYLYSELAIPFERRNANSPLGRLNTDYKLGDSPNGSYPAIIDKAQAAITAYRANPVVTGLRDVRPWMSVHYIANSSGVPVDYIFAQLGLPTQGNADKPLEMLAVDLTYPDGPQAMSDAIQRALAGYQKAP